MNPSSPDLTPVHLVTLLASVVFGPQMAIVVGPYVVIAIASMGGAAVMVMQREGDSLARACVYFLAAVLLALFVTVPLSKGVASLWGPLEENWLYAPLGAAMAFSADKWTSVIFPWAARKVNALVDVWIAARGRKDGDR
jgi:hypothetical protein